MRGQIICLIFLAMSSVVFAEPFGGSSSNPFNRFPSTSNNSGSNGFGQSGNGQQGNNGSTQATSGSGANGGGGSQQYQPSQVQKEIEQMGQAELTQEDQLATQSTQNTKADLDGFYKDESKLQPKDKLPDMSDAEKQSAALPPQTTDSDQKIVDGIVADEAAIGKSTQDYYKTLTPEVASPPPAAETVGDKLSQISKSSQKPNYSMGNALTAQSNQVTPPSFGGGSHGHAGSGVDTGAGFSTNGQTSTGSENQDITAKSLKELAAAYNSPNSNTLTATPVTPR